MDKEKIQQLHNELNELSENEEKNKERMLEIARVLVQIYLPNRKDGGRHQIWFTRQPRDTKGW